MRPAPFQVQRGQTAFPRRLASAEPSAWPSLDVVGQLPDASVHVAIVGARAASGGAIELAQDLARCLAEAGAVVVSGGALGIDGAAHQGALDGGGRTIVVTGTGIDIDYPLRHRRLFDDVVAGGGALVSMFPRGTQPLPGCFVRRNRLIAALADLVVVVEASARSGSLYTAVAAQRLGRPVAACPGSSGTDRLLADGAALVERGADIHAALTGQPRRRELPPLDDAARMLLASVPAHGTSLEQIAIRSGQPLRAVTRGLAALEAAGYLRIDGDSTVSLTGLATKVAPTSDRVGDVAHGR